MACQGATQSGGLTDGLTLHLLMECPSKSFPATVLLLVIVSQGKRFATFLSSLQKISCCRYLRSLHFEERRAGVKSKKFSSLIGIETGCRSSRSMLRSFLRQPVPLLSTLLSNYLAFCTERNFSNLNWIYALGFQEELIQPLPSLSVSQYQVLKVSAIVMGLKVENTEIHTYGKFKLI